MAACARFVWPSSGENWKLCRTDVGGILDKMDWNSR